jgi:hypothetical protein
MYHSLPTGIDEDMAEDHDLVMESQAFRIVFCEFLQLLRLL